MNCLLRLVLLVFALLTAGIALLGPESCMDLLMAVSRPLVLSGTASCRGTAYSDQCKIVTVAGLSFVTWLDEMDGVNYVRIATHDRTTGAWSGLVTIDLERTTEEMIRHGPTAFSFCSLARALDHP